MDANPRTLKNIFETQGRYFVPLFQRPYVWNEHKQWKPLWEDIQAVAERFLVGSELRPHFLGAIVLEQLNTPTGTLDAREIIDGQQRLTTLQLFIGAARDVCKKIGASAESQFKNFDFLTTNRVEEGSDGKFKVVPTNVDRLNFRQAMTAGNPDQLRRIMMVDDEATDLGHLIPNAYVFFFNAIKDWLKSEDSQARSHRLEALVNTIYKGLLAVVIDLDEKDNAQMIFETLNARGTPLLASDLVKNFLLHLVEEKGLPVEQLYTEYWQPFDGTESKFWRQEISQGRLNRPRIELFLQHYLTYKTKEEVPAGDLFVVFRDLVKKSNESPADWLSELHHFGSIFKSFYEQPMDSREGIFFNRIDKLETTTVFPFLLFIFDTLSDRSQWELRRAILCDLESFLVRRMICGLTTKNYNRLFQSLRVALDSNTHNLREQIRDYIIAQKGDSERWPDDTEFSQSWFSVPIYRKITRPRLRMLLKALEMELQNDLSENLPLPKGMTVEHLMPQEWQEFWPLPSGDPDAKTKREALIHTIGNLTLVTKKLNSTLQNGPWIRKRDFILRHSGIALNRGFIDHEEWTEKRIIGRSKDLFKLAKQMWAYPH